MMDETTIYREFSYNLFSKISSYFSNKSNISIHNIDYSTHVNTYTIIFQTLNDSETHSIHVKLTSLGKYLLYKFSPYIKINQYKDIIIADNTIITTQEELDNFNFTYALASKYQYIFDIDFNKIKDFTLAIKKYNINIQLNTYSYKNIIGTNYSNGVDICNIKTDIQNLIIDYYIEKNRH